MIKDFITGAFLVFVAITSTIGISTAVYSSGLPYWVGLLVTSSTICAAYAIFTKQPGE
jgi:hypothetical protein